MQEVPVLQIDLPCENCGYNLRGLPVDRVCPECGGRLQFSWAMALAENAFELRRYFRARGLMTVAAEAGCCVDGVLFVSDAFQFSIESGHQSAKQICRDLAEYARQYFNDEEEAIELLGEWGLGGSEDVGRVIFALVRAGLLTVGPEDRAEDFAGIFRVENLFAGEGMRGE